MKQTLHHLNRRNLLACLWYARWLYLRSRLRLPSPVAFSLRAVTFMFLLLACMPFTPLAIPVVFGAGLSLAIVVR